MVKSYYHYKVLLDENMPNRKALPLLNSHFSVRHIRDDLKNAGMLDPDVYSLAASQGRVIVTRNAKHFRPLAGTQGDAGIIVVSENLLPSQLDKKLTALLKRTNSDTLKGKCLALTAAPTN